MDSPRRWGERMRRRAGEEKGWGGEGLGRRRAGEEKGWGGEWEGRGPGPRA
jgi:hypothetical protein